MSKQPDFLGLFSYLRGSRGLSARRARRTKSRGPKGPQLEVGARRAPTLLVSHYCYYSSALIYANNLLFFRVERQYLVPKNMCLLPGNVAQCSGGAGQMLEMLHPRNMEYRPKQIQVNFTPFWCNLKDDLWKSGCCDLDSERKKVVASSNDSLACALIDLGAFWSVVAHLPS